MKILMSYIYNDFNFYINIKYLNIFLKIDFFNICFNIVYLNNLS